MKPRVFQAFFAVGMLAMACLAGASQNVNINGDIWRVSYDADFLPNNVSSDPAFSTYAVGGGATGNVGGGILTMTNSTGFVYAEMNNTTFWNGGSGGTRDNTIAFRMRGSNGHTPANADFTGNVFFGDGTVRWFFQFDNNRVRIAGTTGPFYAIDTTQFHTYRITTKNGLASLYVDGSFSPAISNIAGQNIAQNFIYFGQDSSVLKGTTEWDYFRWSNDIASIPEPVTAAIVLPIGIAALLARRPRRSRRVML